MKAVSTKEFTAQEEMNGNLLMNLSHNFRNVLSRPEVTRDYIRKALETEAYKSYKYWGTATKKSHPTFYEFFTSPSPEGLGYDIHTLRELCKVDRHILNLVDQDIQKAHPHGGARTKNQEIDSISCTNDMPEGGECDSHCPPIGTPNNNSTQGIIRRLRKEGKNELLTKLLNHKVTPNEAAIMAGYRPRRFSISGENPVSAARTILKNTPPEFVTELIRLLLKG